MCLYGNSTKLLQSGPGTHLWILGTMCTVNSLIGIVDTLAKIKKKKKYMNTEVQDKGE